MHHFQTSCVGVAILELAIPIYLSIYNNNNNNNKLEYDSLNNLLLQIKLQLIYTFDQIYEYSG